MSDYRFDFRQADATLDEMHAINSRVRQGLDHLESQVNAHLAEWEGETKAAYEIAKVEWNQRANQMPDQLETGRKVLLTISDNYGTIERRTRMIWENSRG